MKIDQHVVQREHGWAVLGEGNQRDTIVLPTQGAAIAQARKIARNQGSGLIVHAASGQIRNLDSSHQPRNRR
jgi:hypothetical protein